MAEHSVSLEIPNAIEVGKTDLKIRVRRGGKRFGTLTVSRGTIDWRPLQAKSGKKGETQLSWVDFDKWMKRANRHKTPERAPDRSHRAMPDAQERKERKGR